MFKLERILFPVDFSDRSRKAVAYVDVLATQFGAEVILLHIVPPPAYNAPLSEPAGTHWETFGPAFTRHHLKMQRLTEHGDIATKIIECAQAYKADLIMTPTHGLGVFRRLMLGSNTAKVLHDAECPVWTGVHIEDSPRAEKQVPYRRVLCGLDLEPQAERVLRWAAGLAAGFHAELTIVHVTTNSVQARQRIQSVQEAAGTNAPVRIEAGEAPKVIAHVAQDMGTDLLVIGRHRTEAGRPEMIAYSTIRQSPCPVVSV